ARRDGDDVLDAGDELHAALDRVRHDLRGDVDRDVPRARLPERLGHLPADRLELALAGVAELDVERHVLARHLDVAGRARGDEILAGVRVDELPESVLNGRFTEGHG